MVTINTNSAKIYGDRGVASYYINDSGDIKIIERGVWKLTDTEYFEAIRLLEGMLREQQQQESRRNTN